MSARLRVLFCDRLRRGRHVSWPEIPAAIGLRKGGWVAFISPVFSTPLARMGTNQNDRLGSAGQISSVVIISINATILDRT